ncbi:glycosyltransferase [Pelagicoccus sp. SDUM812002]|uniref:glycosyltransferase n=1 Tax=Pelagicoccus sp. SDUM812002 TaxID=3041266 RepID=UPI00280D688E|nr:glycosyltransferase [Pelagicoccus sp. SDUM812002]MDQ8185287.1 glycosyltransferase [Pelagicoccus sp. SDUM812002]
MTIVITTHGSTGDIYPLIRLAISLQDAGHTVRFATSRPFKPDVESAGVPFFQIPPDWEKSELQYWMGRLQKLKSPVSQLKEMYKAATPHLEAILDAMEEAIEGADCLVSSYLFPINKAIAEKHNIPFVSYAFAHNTVPSRFYPPHEFPRLRGMPDWLQLRWNRLCWKIGNVVVDTAINTTISRAFKRKGLPGVKDFFSKSAELVLVAVSPSLMRPKIKLHPRFQFTGYCRWQYPTCERSERAIEDFRGKQPVPIITFGSMVYDQPEAVMARLVTAWPKDRKLIVQTGWSGFKVPPSATNILELGPMSHDQLLRHASVVIHHGGAGTTASVLYAGKPHIVVPHIGDQDFFSAEVKRLGCGIKLGKKSWPEKLAAKVEQIEGDSSYQVAAQQALIQLEQEDGPTEAVHQIEAFLQHRRQLIGEFLSSDEEF